MSSKFADDTNIGRVIQSDHDISIFQDELDRLYDWAGKWKMEFNVRKCSAMRVGRNN